MKNDHDHAQFSLALAYGLAVVNALIIGLSFSFVKVAVTLAGPVDTLAFRFVIALAVCVLYAKIKGIRPRFDWKNSLRLLPMGLAYPLGFFLFQGFGLMYASSGEAGILTATGPIFTAIIAATFIRERYNFLQSLSILLSVAGAIYIAYQKGASLDPDNIAGIVLILLSALSGALYAVFNRVLVRSFTTFEITYYLMIVGAVAFGGASLVQHAVNETFATMFVPFSEAKFTTAILYLALFSSLLTTVFASLALNRLTSAGLTIFFNADCMEVLPTLESVSLIVADPPYGCAFVSNMRTVSEQPPMLANDEKPHLEFVPPIVRAVKPDSAIYLCTRFAEFSLWENALKEAGATVKTPIVWDKTVHTMGDIYCDYGNQVELILFAHVGRPKLRRGRPLNLWTIPREPSGPHPTPKPVELFKRCILNSSDPGDLVLDPFLGSGTAAVACVLTGRRFVGIELEPKYFDLSCARIEKAYRDVDSRLPGFEPAALEEQGLLFN